MSFRMIKVLVNEKSQSVPENTCLGELRDREKPDADVLVVNGFPAEEDYTLKEADCVVFIKKGEKPGETDLEVLMMARHTPGVHERMRKAIVGLAGLGGLGSSVAIALARMGIGTLILVDHDVVEPSNLNRQQYFIEHLGMLKTEAMRKLLVEINPYVRIIVHDVELDVTNIPDLFKEADVVVECFDRAEAKAMILETVSESLPNTYIIGASGLAGFGESNRIKTRRIGEKIFLVGDMEIAAEPGCGLMAPRVGVAAHHQANLVVSLLMDPSRAIEETEDILE